MTAQAFLFNKMPSAYKNSHSPETLFSQTLLSHNIAFLEAPRTKQYESRPKTKHTTPDG